MGFYGLLPARKSRARYYSSSQKLVLTASGEAEEATSGIGFTQQTFVGGLKFNFGGWTGPLIEPPTDFKYTRSSVFSMALPNRATPSNTVIICSSTNPQGTVVKIDFIEEPSTKSVLPPTEPGPIILPQGTSQGDENMTVLYNMPFEITNFSKIDSGGAITISFDSNMLDMTTSSIQSSTINWTFNSLQTGNTQIVINTNHGVSQLSPTKKTYDVRIIVLDERPRSLAAIRASQKSSLPLSWLGCINIGYNLILATSPSATLYKIHSTPYHPGPAFHPLELPQLTITCRQANSKGMVHIHSRGWGEFGPVILSQEPMVGLASLDWPVETNIVEAWGLAEKVVGYKEGLKNCELKKLLHLGVEEGKYYFTLESGGVVSVGSVTGQVEVLGR